MSCWPWPPTTATTSSRPWPPPSASSSDELGYLFVDPLAGGVVSIIILLTGVEIIRESAADLMNTLPGKKLTEEIREQAEKDE